LTRAAAWVAVAALAAGGCGGDDESETDTGARTQTTPTTETEEPRATVTSPGPAPEATVPEGESPEDQPGGAGDEVPARSLALFNARAGRIRPAVVRVPPFIAIRVELHSNDGRSYALTFGDRTVRVGPRISSASTVLDGLRPGRAYTGTPRGRGNPVRIEASAEPGP
jgi:hypothetical protein